MEALSFDFFEQKSVGVVANFNVFNYFHWAVQSRLTFPEL